MLRPSLTTKVAQPAMEVQLKDQENRVFVGIVIANLDGPLDSLTIYAGMYEYGAGTARFNYWAGKSTTVGSTNPTFVPISRQSRPDIFKEVLKITGLLT